MRTKTVMYNNWKVNTNKVVATIFSSVQVKCYECKWGSKYSGSSSSVRTVNEYPFSLSVLGVGIHVLKVTGSHSFSIKNENWNVKFVFSNPYFYFYVEISIWKCVKEEPFCTWINCIDLLRWFLLAIKCAFCKK